VIVDKSPLRLYPSADGMMHDECMVGIGGSALHWSKAVRNLPDTAQLHETVYARLAMKSVRNYTSFGPYRPVALLSSGRPPSHRDPSARGTRQRPISFKWWRSKMAAKKWST
jgi:hypothetical protein